MRAVAWLLLLGLLSNIYGYDGPRFINLSYIDYAVVVYFDKYSIHWKLLYNDGTITMTCARCDKNLNIKCNKDEVVNVAIQVEGPRQTFEVPFNVTCNSNEDSNNKFVVETIDAQASANEVIFIWRSPNDAIQEYLVYFMTSSTHKSQQISTNRISFDNLSEKTWHQICIASIDNLWRTSKFTCRNVLTDFFTTGPVTHITAVSDSDKISVTWNNPQYKHDIPQGYTVHINGATNICRTIIIHMMAVHIPTNGPCPHRQFLNWTRLQDLHIDKLPPYSHFNIDVISFNQNKPFINKSISIQTKEGESDAVQNLQSFIHNNYLLVTFKEPSSPQGTIIKYYMKISRVQTDICRHTNDVVHQSNITKLYDYIPVDVVKRCGRYLIEISPMNGWSRKGGQGKTTSTIFIKSPNTRSVAISAHIKFITSNSLVALLDNISSDDNCRIIGFAIEIKSESVTSNCVTRIITNVKCTTLINMVTKVSQCATKEWRQFNTTSGKVVSYFNGIFINGGDYQSTIWSITDKLEEVSRVNIKAGEIQDCFTDCYDSARYYGIRSAGVDGTACTEWQKSDTFRSYGPALSNICLITSNDGRPWCPTKTSYEYCNIPKCSHIKSGTGCVTVTSNRTTTETILINWSTSQYATSNIGYITLLHNTDHLCEKYHVQMCRNCPSENNLDNIVKNLYLSCSVGQVDNTISYETQFSGLHQDKQYIVYIVPIVSTSMVGEVKNMTIRTAMATIINKVAIYVVIGYGLMLESVMVLLLLIKFGSKQRISYKNSSANKETDTTKISQLFKSDAQRNTSICLQEFSSKYAQLAADGNGRIIREYEKLINEPINIEKSMLLTTNVAQSPINIGKNRYPNILPYDQYRVKLQDESSTNNYINASHIPFNNDVNKMEYIAAQGPLDDTVDHFWQMIWYENVSCIVMLTKTMEEDEPKCAQYYPTNVGQIICYGKKKEIKVKLANEERQDHIERRFAVFNEKTGDNRTIMHFHLSSWFDYAAPDVDKFDKLLFRFHETTNTTSPHPVLVHCSAGAGATGTFICIDRIIRGLVQGAEEINIYDAVLLLRRYRQCMVQRQVQYNFIYFYINYFLDKYVTTNKTEGGLYLNN